MYQSVSLLNTFFYIGIILFLVGGVSFLFQQKIFSSIFNSFKKFYKHSSKLNEYVDETVGSTENVKISTHYVVMRKVLFYGLTMIVLSTVTAVVFY